jgi:membrane dipeptidase
MFIKKANLSARLAIIAALFFIGQGRSYIAGEDLAERARRIQKAAIVVDTHLDLPIKLRQKWADLSLRGATPHFDIPRAREGGMTAPFFAIYVPASFAEAGGAIKEALELIDMINLVVSSHSTDLEAATSVADIRRIKKLDKIAVLMGLEGGHIIEDSLGALRDLYRLGARYMTLTHFNSNHWADSSGAAWLPDYDPKTTQLHHGLTDFGRAVVREMNRLGMMVDISHVSDETLDDVLAVTRAPIIATHSSCRFLCNVPRNLNDDQIRRIAKTGGVVMINFSSDFLDQKIVDATDALNAKIRPEYERLKKQFAGDPRRREEAIDKLLGQLPISKAPWTMVVDHIEHVIKVAGPDAVGLGTDFDGIDAPPEGLEDVSKLPKITEELLRRGYSEEVVRKVLGENFLGFFSRVEDVARTLSSEPPSTARIDK